MAVNIRTKKREAPAGFAHGVSLVYKVKPGYTGGSADGEI
jgi:hypothetical protein